MGGLNVKNTIVERILQVLAPHLCLGCGKVGQIICEDCKYDIDFEPFSGCILCGTPSGSGICWTHHSPVGRAFTVGQRHGVLEDAINQLKFHHMKAAARTLAELLDRRLPFLPSGIELVPIPTVGSHIRQRGYDHAALLAAHFGSIRELPVHRYLRRATKTTQHTAGKHERVTQASQAFSLVGAPELKGKTILLVDDIVTTGSTLESAAKLLTKAGALVWVATLAYQPLD